MFGSSVVPDFEETKKSVFARSSSSSSVVICCGSVESSTRSRGSPSAGGKVSAEHLRAETRPAHPQQQRLLEAARADVVDQRAEAVRVRELVHRHRQPAEPASPRRRRSRAGRRGPTAGRPCRRRATPRSPRPPGPASSAGSERVNVGGLRLGRRPQRLLDRGEQLGLGLDELLDALVEQRGGDLVEVDALLARDPRAAPARRARPRSASTRALPWALNAS